jgi:ADP-ribose pyrophosphatase
VVAQSLRDHDGVEIVAEEAGYDGFFELRRVNLKHRLFAGGISAVFEREIFIRHDAVAILPYDPHSDCVLFVEQLRMGALYRDESPWLLEMVAGIVDTGESLCDIAKREAQEEAGLQIEAIEAICEYFPSPGGSCEYLSLFCGKADLSHAGGVHGLDSENEDIRAHVFSYSEACELLAQNTFRDAQTIIGLQWLMLNRDRLRKQWL